MASKNTPSDVDRRDQIIAEVRRHQAQQEKTYRGQALKMYPWICARCGREFGGKTLRELTVHHKDHNHDNNPPDGSNWELLCLYCHDNEHARQLLARNMKERGVSEYTIKVLSWQFEPKKILVPDLAAAVCASHLHESRCTIQANGLMAQLLKCL